MDDAKIKEEFEKYLDGDINTTATMFGYRYETERKGSKSGYKNMAQGFYAGFRTAERLAKIDVLEEVSRMMDKLRFFSIADYEDAKDRIACKIAEIKAGQ